MRTVNVVLLSADSDGEAVANHRYRSRGVLRLWEYQFDRPSGKKEKLEDEAAIMVQDRTSNWSGSV